MNANRKVRTKPRLGRKTQYRKVPDGRNDRMSGKRLTLRPGFLMSGIASKTVKRDTKEVADKYQEHVLREDLHSLFQHNTKKLRRSERILEKGGKKEFVYGDIFANKSDSMGQISNERDSSNHFKYSKCSSQFQGSEINLVPENKSKSVFSEINRRYEEIQVAERGVGNKYSPEKTSFCGFVNSSPYPLANRSFCEDFLQQIRVRLASSRNVKSQCVGNIFREIESVNLALQGKQQVPDMYSRVERPPVTSNDEEVTQNFGRIPRRQWIFSTPPNRKPESPKNQSGHLQPAVVFGSRGDRYNIYEINPAFNMSLITPNMQFDEGLLKNGNMFPNSPINFKLAGGCFQPVLPEGKLKNNSKHFSLLSRPMVGLEKPFPMCNRDSPNERQDFTFVEDGDGYKIQETQGSVENQFGNFDTGRYDNLFDFSNMNTKK
ncbi:uncharacterized protein LOC132706153 [Cylas formicarius]|uniref:uncharacterized protein LOC132706153 n=1 Tax=Cylas formicarius TaxID=197179 RepID=UPI002958C12B|nr:uncharacterized protein LOC132706153 [Cylas formicarius]XP_060533305.1 uncharacterized protein LOC132706153 [Cylas formicarius]XP_060533306.1 uncharacterized protein LOC132706153 [Cylas formicarius]